MPKINVNQGQNLLDVTLQEYGSIEGVINLVFDNELTLNDTLIGGQELTIDESKTVTPDVVQYFVSQKIKVNTGELPPVEEELRIFDDSFDASFE